MSHPRDRRERFLKGKHLGEKRAFGEFGACKYLSKEEMERFAYQRRNTTKICSCSMCGNPRRKSWKTKNKLTLQELRYEGKDRYGY